MMRRESGCHLLITQNHGRLHEQLGDFVGDGDVLEALVEYCKPLNRLILIKVKV